MAADLPPPIPDAAFPSPDRRVVELGQLLFFDKVLSGNRNIACSTCHHPDHGGSDGLSLGIGEGGHGIGPDRTAGTGADRIAARIPRNAPGLWNLGHEDIRVLFDGGRLETSDLYGNGFNSPAREWLPQGLDSILAAQALMPMTGQFEMAGQPGENAVAGAARDRMDKVWPILARRVRTIPEYGRRFVAAFDGIDRPGDVTIVEIANALAAFMTVEWESHDSPFDRYLDGDTAALSPAATRGMHLFYGKGKCASCHSGPLLTDQKFHALGLPAFGPGRVRAFEPRARDVGRMGESDRREDAYRFRTPPLRNVALTPPYGHDGAYPTLRGILRHHADPAAARAAWRPRMAHLPEAPWLAATDFVIRDDAAEMARQRAADDLPEIDPGAGGIDDLVAFLHALTGATAEELPYAIPAAVPSGLPVE